MIEPILKPKHIKELDYQRILDIQTALSTLGYYPPDKIDGINGAITESALKDFKKDHWLEYPMIIGNSTIDKLNLLAKKDNLPSNFNVKDKNEVIKAIINEGKKQGMCSCQIAYALATIDHETNNTFKPVVEAYWLSEEWRKNNLRYYPFHGRGFIQITWKYNYQKYSYILNKNLVDNPDLALDPQISLFIAIHGMVNGIFTHSKVSDFINESKKDFYNARRVINGLDKANTIADLTKFYLKTINI